MEATPGISLYSYLLTQLTKTNALSFLLLLMSSLQQNWRKGQNRFYLEVREVGGEGGSGEQGEEMTQTMYAHVNK
jgi:hypothetical protein